VTMFTARRAPRRHALAQKLPLVLAVAAVFGVALAGTGALRRMAILEARIADLEAERELAADRERQLQSLVARQVRRIQSTEGELSSLRFQMDAIEMQLDGVEYLGRELGSAAGAGETLGRTRQQPEAAGGGLTGDETLADRMAGARRRLGAVLGDLFAAREHMLRSEESVVDADAGDGRSPESAGSSLLHELQPEAYVPGNWPARGIVSSGFGWRSFRGRLEFHSGIDVAVRHGSQVLSTAAGTVVGSGWQPGYGWSVLVQHRGGYSTLYAHLSRSLVDLGDRVVRGTSVGLSGDSGNSTGPHLHYEIWKDGRVLDPRPLMDGTGGSPDG